MKITTTAMTQTNRNYAFDVIRIVAILAVIMIHASGRIVTSDTADSYSFVVSNFFDSISRLGVPLFIMISGALMLNENKPNVTIKKMATSSFNIAKLLVLWSFVYTMVFSVIIPLRQGNEIVVAKVIRHFLIGHYHLWFLYMIIGLYLFTPILRLFVKKENHKQIVYFLVLSIAVKFCTRLLNFFINYYVPDANSMFKVFMDNFKFYYISEYVTYYILGWYVTTFQIQKKHRRLLYLFGLIGVSCAFLFTHFYANSENQNFIFYKNDNITTLFYSLAVFVFIYNKCSNISFKNPKLIVNISNLTFGVYIIHDFFLKISYYISDDFTNVICKMLFDFVFATVISFAVAFIASKIPILKKAIKC